MYNNLIRELPVHMSINYGTHSILALAKNTHTYLIIAKTENGGNYELATVKNGNIKFLKANTARIKMLLCSKKVNDFIQKISKISIISHVLRF